MEKLLKKIGHYTLHDALLIEKTDIQFQALEYLYSNIQNKDTFIPLILANATVGYLLSSSGESYWKEFSLYFKGKNIPHHTIIDEMKIFIKQSRGNKRLNNHKNKRLEKLRTFLNIFEIHRNILYIDQETFSLLLAAHMKQPKNAKTITFSLKMLIYGLRIETKKDIIAPVDISIPIDSRLSKIYQMYNTDKNLTIEEFYTKISEKLNIPPLHLDGIIWTKYKEIITNID